MVKLGISTKKLSTTRVEAGKKAYKTRIKRRDKITEVILDALRKDSRVE